MAVAVAVTMVAGATAVVATAAVVVTTVAVVMGNGDSDNSSCGGDDGSSGNGGSGDSGSGDGGSGNSGNGDSRCGGAVVMAAVAAMMAAVATAMSAVKTVTTATMAAVMMVAAVTVAAAAELMALVETKRAVTTATTIAAIVVAAVTVSATAVGGEDNGGDSDGWGHRQQSTKIGSKDTVAGVTAMETAAVGAATIAMGTPRTAPGIGADRLPLPLPGRVVGADCDGCVWGCACWLCVLVVCVLRAPVVLLGSRHNCIKKFDKPWHIGDCWKGLDETNQTITFN